MRKSMFRAARHLFAEVADLLTENHGCPHSLASIQNCVTSSRVDSFATWKEPQTHCLLPCGMAAPEKVGAIAER